MVLKDRAKYINNDRNCFTIPAFKRDELETIIDLMKNKENVNIIYQKHII